MLTPVRESKNEKRGTTIRWGLNGNARRNGEVNDMVVRVGSLGVGHVVSEGGKNRGKDVRERDENESRRDDRKTSGLQRE